MPKSHEFSYLQFTETSHYLFLGYRWFKCQGAPGRRNELSKITLESNRGMPWCKGWSMGNVVPTMALTVRRSQRPGMKRNPKALGVSQAELPAFAVHREQAFSPLWSHGLPHPIPFARLQNEPLYRTSKTRLPSSSVQRWKN